MRRLVEPTDLCGLLLHCEVNVALDKQGDASLVDQFAVGDIFSFLWLNSSEKERRTLFFIVKRTLLISDLERRVAALPFQRLKHFVNRCDRNVVDVIGHRFLCDA